MSGQKQANQTPDAAIGEDLKVQICNLVDSLVQRKEEDYEADFVHFLTKAQDLIERKRAMEGTKTDTRDLLGELLFSRLRRGMKAFLDSEDVVNEIKAAEWVIGCLFSISTLSEFAQAFDRAIIEQGGPRDFSFAGRSDFISLEEVLQMLAAGKHVGCLSVEKGDNRLDIYLQNGRVAFLDPHHMIRRVLPSADPMKHREIPVEAVSEAEQQRATAGQPVFLSLEEKGFFKGQELREVMRELGKEVLYDFMRDHEVCAFFYRRMDELPPFAGEHNLRIGVTSMLLEGSKRVDDWNSMCQVFPDPSQPIEPKSDMYSRMSDVNLGVVEIKLLSLINGENSAKCLVPLLGLPLHDIYQILVRLAREGILSPPGGMDSLMNVSISVEESMQMAFECLDANDDTKMRESALDRVLGQALDGGAEHEDDENDVDDGIEDIGEDDLLSSESGEASSSLGAEILEILRRKKRD